MNDPEAAPDGASRRGGDVRPAVPSSELDAEGGERRLSPQARRLLGAADRLFYAKGTRATTVREITEACGLTPGALYNHFSSKDELLFVLVRHRHLTVERRVAEAQSAVKGDPVAEFRAIIDVYVRTHVDQRGATEVANREYRHLPGPGRDEILAIRRRLRNRMVEVLERGETEGRFRPVSANGRRSNVLAAGVILEMCIGSSQWVRRDGPLDLDALVASFTTMALRVAGYRED